MILQKRKREYKFFDHRIHAVGDNLKNISLPGFDKVSLYDVINYFFKGMSKGAITTRASSIAFQFFLASLPAIIFFFTLIPYIPIDNFQEELMGLFQNMLPKNVFGALESSLEDIFAKKRSGLQLFGFLVALFFATNGLNSIIKAFNATYHTIETRTPLERRLISTLLVFLMTGLLTFAITLIILGKIFVYKLTLMEIFRSSITYSLIILGNWFIILLLIFFTVSFLYYFAPARKTKWKIFSPGSTLATFLIFIATLGFSYYVNQFGQFNKLFGSIGTIMVLMIWLNLIATSLLIGFELNASIKNAKLEIEEQDDNPIITEYQHAKENKKTI
ncbi:MAG: YihY/virulence factor BrkB family protein [bacterium]